MFGATSSPKSRRLGAVGRGRVVGSTRGLAAISFFKFVLKRKVVLIYNRKKLYQDFATEKTLGSFLKYSENC